MRDIEFRLWSEELNCYLKSEELYFVYNGGKIENVQITNRTITAPLTKYTLEQFTGLLDKNGTKIFEGDCDKAGNVVEYSDGVYTLNGDRPLHMMLNVFEVIGNIHDKEAHK